MRHDFLMVRNDFERVCNDFLMVQNDFERVRIEFLMLLGDLLGFLAHFKAFRRDFHEAARGLRGLSDA